MSLFSKDEDIYLEDNVKKGIVGNYSYHKEKTLQELKLSLINWVNSRDSEDFLTLEKYSSIRRKTFLKEQFPWFSNYLPGYDNGFKSNCIEKGKKKNLDFKTETVTGNDTLKKVAGIFNVSLEEKNKFVFKKVDLDLLNKEEIGIYYETRMRDYLNMVLHHIQHKGNPSDRMLTLLYSLASQISSVIENKTDSMDWIKTTVSLLTPEQADFIEYNSNIEYFYLIIYTVFYFCYICEMYIIVKKILPIFIKKAIDHYKSFFKDLVSLLMRRCVARKIIRREMQIRRYQVDIPLYNNVNGQVQVAGYSKMWKEECVPIEKIELEKTQLDVQEIEDLQQMNNLNAVVWSETAVTIKNVEDYLKFLLQFTENLNKNEIEEFSKSGKNQSEIIEIIKKLIICTSYPSNTSKTYREMARDTISWIR